MKIQKVIIWMTPILFITNVYKTDDDINSGFKGHVCAFYGPSTIQPLHFIPTDMLILKVLDLMKDLMSLMLVIQLTLTIGI